MALIGLAGLIGAERSILRKLRKAGAVSPETAVTPEQAGLTSFERKSLSWLKRRGKIGKTEDGRYYVA